MKAKLLFAFFLACLLSISLCACGEKPTEETTLHIAALKGPTAMGMAYMMSNTSDAYDFTLAGSADEVTPKLIKGELDIACIPANLASVLYNKTDGGIVTLAINTLGVLYIVENGEQVHSITDLAGKTIIGAGKGSTPEYVLRYLLSENGLNPDSDVTLDWKNEHSECVAALAAGTATVALLPQPFVTVAQGKIAGLRIALNLNKEWENLDNGSALLTGVVIARKEIVENYSKAITAFLEDYRTSVDWVNSNMKEAAALVREQGIVDSTIAEKALPYCNIVCITGNEMKQKLSGYLNVLCAAAPESIGGRLPQDDFYYEAEG